MTFYERIKLNEAGLENGKYFVACKSLFSMDSSYLFRLCLKLRNQLRKKSWWGLCTWERREANCHFYPLNSWLTV